MFRSSDTLTGSNLPGSVLETEPTAVNQIVEADQFVTLEPTPKPESRRGWRRRRVRRGKS